jgi:hypothetical protein
MNAQMGSRGIALLFLQPRAPAALPQKTDPVSILQKVGWAPRPVWNGAENLSHTEFRSPESPALRESLYRLRYPDPFPSSFTGIKSLTWYRVSASASAILVSTDKSKLRQNQEDS